MVFTVSRFGRPVIELGPHRFNKWAYSRGARAYWTCVKQSKQCRARLVTFNDVIVKILHQHNHWEEWCLLYFTVGSFLIHCSLKTCARPVESPTRSRCRLWGTAVEIISSRIENIIKWILLYCRVSRTHVCLLLYRENNLTFYYFNFTKMRLDQISNSL